MKTEQISFKGIDARPIKGLIARDVGCGDGFNAIISEVSKIAKREGFDVFIQNQDGIKKASDYVFNSEKSLPNESFYTWAQDNLTFTPDGKLLANHLLEPLNLLIEKLIKSPITNLKHHIQGGNFFITKNGNHNDLIIGKDELNYYKPQQLMQEFNIEKIYPISQPDFHIDLGIRPLNNKNVLVDDKNLTLNLMKEGIKTAKEYALRTQDPEIRAVQLALEDSTSTFEIGQYENKYKNNEKIVEELKEYGFNPIKVPGSFIRPYFIPLDNNKDNHYMMNYLNAIVHERPDGSLVYITNASLLDEINGITPEVEKKIKFSFKKIFLDSIKDYISPKDVYFINGNGFISRSLEHSQGGIHCLFSEIPMADK